MRRDRCREKMNSCHDEQLLIFDERSRDVVALNLLTPTNLLSNTPRCTLSYGTMCYMISNTKLQNTFLLALRWFSRIPVSENIQLHNCLHMWESTPTLELRSEEKEVEKKKNIENQLERETERQRQSARKRDRYILPYLLGKQVK